MAALTTRASRTTNSASLIQRDADDQLSFVETRFFNASRLRYKGCARWRSTTGGRLPFLGVKSEVGVNLSYQYLDR